MSSSLGHFTELPAVSTTMPSIAEGELTEEDDTGRMAFKANPGWSSVTSADALQVGGLSLTSDPMLMSLGSAETGLTAHGRAACGTAFAPEDGARAEEENITPQERLERMPGIVEVQGHLGRGSFGSVFQCIVEAMPEPVAVKVVTGISHSAIREVQVLASLGHPKLVNMHRAVEGPPTCLILELCTGGNLQTFMHVRPGCLEFERLSLQQRGSALIDVSEAVGYLHSLGVVHRDIKSANCLLISPMLPEAATMPGVKVADFGFARFLEKAQGTPIMTECTGTVCYMAPEVAVSNRYNTAADIYSCGILFNEIITGDMPFGKRIFDIRLTVEVSRGKRPTVATCAGADLCAVIELCWHTDPKQRLAADEMSRRISLIFG